jgi:membrane-bound serine protease (ClpP class)
LASSGLLVGRVNSRVLVTSSSPGLLVAHDAPLGSPRRAKLLALVLALAAAAPLYTLWVAHAQPGAASLVVVGRVDGVIDGATCDYVKSLLSYAAERGAALAVLELNTPGGSLDSALCIIDSIQKSSIPVAGYVVERWAVSAGTLILMCAHYAAMQPGTIIGAAQPVALTPSGGYVPINESKILNPIYKKMEACMKLHGRNATVARLFVYKNLVLTPDEALKKHVIEAVAVNLQDLLAAINGSTVRLGMASVRVVLHNPTVELYEMSLGQRVLHSLSDPLVSSILSSLGILLLIAALAAGAHHLVVVAIALILLSFLGLGMASSLAAAALLVFGLILLLIELFVTPGFGAIGFTGIALIILGVIIGFSGKPAYIAGESLAFAQKILLAVVTPLAGLMGLIVYKAAKAWRRKPAYQPTPEGKVGRAIDPINPGALGFVIVDGEYWQAKNIDSEPIKPNDKVTVVGKDGAILLVRKYKGEGPEGERAAS